MKIKTKNDLVEEIVHYLKENLGENILCIYGIGSYFDSNLPRDWIKNDIDIIVIVQTLNPIPKEEWTDVRFEKKQINGVNIWIGFNTIQGLQKKDLFQLQSFANYEWSLIDLKLPENSVLIYGEDVRNQLPNIIELHFDYDDILGRSLYHLDRSLKETQISGDSLKSISEFTKAVFKFGFYLCIFLDKNYQLTSIQAILRKLEKLASIDKVDKIMLDFINKAFNYRRKSQFGNDFKTLRTNFIVYIFSLLVKGKIHKKMEYDEILKFLTIKFKGFPFLIEFLNNLRKKYFQSKMDKNE